MGQTLGQLVGLVAELVHRQGPAEGIPAGGRQAADGETALMCAAYKCHLAVVAQSCSGS